MMAMAAGRERAGTAGSAGAATATRQVLAASLAAALLVGVGLLHVAARVAAVNAGYRLGKAEELHRDLERENVALKLQRATLRSAAHLEATARTHLGMVTPSAQAVLHIGGPVVPVARPAPVPAKKAAHPTVALLTVGER